MKLDMDVMKLVHQSTLVSAAGRLHGERGIQLARLLLERLPDVHRVLPVELLDEGLVVVAPLEDADMLSGFGEETIDLAGVTAYPYSGFTVRLAATGYRVSPGVIPHDQIPAGVAYRFSHPRKETWLVGSEELDVLNPISDAPSAFAVPLFTELNDALDHYASDWVRECRCLVLTRAWLDAKRYFWKQRPEEEIRRSLEQYLASTLRDSTVEVEHVVDERKEADILVYWAFSRQVALIECKWLGVSFSEVDSSGSRKRNSFSPQDAIDGLAQLADYLDRKRPRASGRSVIGHLVVIDGRRWGIGSPDNAGTPTVERLLRHEYDRIPWPAELVQRSDMAAPRRMFCRPAI